MTNKNMFFLWLSLLNNSSIIIFMGKGERFPVSLNAVNVVCFKIDWEEKMLNVLLLKRSIVPQKTNGHFMVVLFKVMKL